MVRSVRFRARPGTTTRARAQPDTGSSGVSDAFDLLLISGELADGVVGSIKLIGVAAHAIADAMPDVDLSDFDFLEILDILDF
jgi:hypothetical protein